MVFNTKQRDFFNAGFQKVKQRVNQGVRLFNQGRQFVKTNLPKAQKFISNVDTAYNNVVVPDLGRNERFEKGFDKVKKGVAGVEKAQGIIDRTAGIFAGQA